MSEYPEIAARFTQATANHRMTVLHNDDLYRHLRFMNPRSSEYWFEIVTWPGCLTIRGDVGDGYTFSRERDMFPFFRNEYGGINPHYWAEKLGGGRNSVKEYSESAARQRVIEAFVDAVRWSDAPRGLGKAVRAEVLNQSMYHEGEARELIDGFDFKGWTFGENTWEWDLRDYDPAFVWCCYAIAWGIARYDEATADAEVGAAS
ncbi:hypothetical protein ACWDXD_33770 [Streptomyces sp. NPDC003314]